MSKEPKYRQVEESIRQMIQLGTLKVGDQIPTEEEPEETGEEDTTEE